MLSVQGALLGRIKPNLRAVAVGWSGRELIRIKFILDKPPQKDDFDLLSEISGEVLADYPRINIEETCDYSLNPYNELLDNEYNFFAFLRNEEIE